MPIEIGKITEHPTPDTRDTTNALPNAFTREDALVLAARHNITGASVIELARQYYDFVHESDEQLPTPPDGMQYELRPIHPEPSPPAHGLAVGDVIDNLDRDDVRAWLDRVPVGGVITDVDGDTYTKTTEAWAGRYESHKGGEVYWLVKYLPLTITALPDPDPTPEPEYTTPRAGDTVRVREGAAHCSGTQLVMVGLRDDDSDSQDYWATYSGSRGGVGGTGHFGPLSDFELIERAK